MKWQDFAHLSLEREKNKLQSEPRARSGSIKVRMTVNMVTKMVVLRPARIAELPRSKFDPELFPHSAYVEIFVTFATKVPYLTFCNKM